MEPFDRWRAELTGELGKAEQALVAAEAELIAAAVAAREAKIKRRTLVEAFERLHPGVTISGSLDRRRRDEDQRLTQADRTVPAKLNVQSARRLIADIEDGLAQLDMVDPRPAMAAELVAEPAPSLGGDDDR